MVCQLFVILATLTEKCLLALQITLGGSSVDKQTGMLELLGDVSENIIGFVVLIGALD